jgi:hypothetical protein
MKMASSDGDNTTQGNASLICIGDHSSGKMLASMQHAQGPEAHKPTTSRPKLGTGWSFQELPV